MVKDPIRHSRESGNPVLNKFFFLSTLSLRERGRGEGLRL
jgi:hypothetical protein